MKMDASEVRRAIEKLDSLSTIPVVLTQVIRATADPSSDPDELYKIISRDQALSSKVLKLANSPFFGYSGKIGELEQAIILLGYDRIRNLSLSISVISMFSKKGDVNLRNFWAHSYEVAFISAYIAESATMLNSQEIFMAGLLHDLGRLIFYKLYRDRYRAILGTDDILEMEVSAFGCDHAEAGSWFAVKTRLPEEQVLAIRHHHAPSGAPQFRDFVSVISLAEALSRRYSPKIEDDGIWTEEHDAILLELGLTNEDLEEIGNRLFTEEAEIQGFLELL